MVLAACGQAPAATTDSPDSANPAVDLDIAIPTGQAVNPQPVTEATVVDASGNEVLFSVTMGVEPCDVIDRIEVVETATSVDVKIFRGVGDIAATCIAIAQERGALAELDAPLGDRLLTLNGVEIAR
jgi:hypothetical protein